MTDVKIGHPGFVEFLDRELPALGLVHWYNQYEKEYGPTGILSGHRIGTISKIEKSFFWYRWSEKAHTVVAEIVAEPGSPVLHALTDAFRIQACDPAAIPALKTLLEKFDALGTGFKTELIY